MARMPSSFRRLLLFLFIGVSCALLVLVLIVAAFVNAKVAQRFDGALALQRREVTDNIDFFCEQQEKLASDPWFHETRTEGDAGPLLNAWTTFEPGKKPPQGSPLALPEQLSLPDKDWPLAPVDVSSLDFGWMQRLQPYDRWDILNRPQMDPRKPLDWRNEPVPELAPLRVWAKLRFLQGLRSGRPLEAAKEVRHLAWILYRTDTPLGAVYAAVLLGLEREAHDSMREPPPEWRLMSYEHLLRMRWLALSSMAFSSVGAPPEVAKRARRCGAPAVTRCIGLAEAGALARFVKPALENDDEFRESYAAFKEDLAASPCATSLAQSL